MEQTTPKGATMLKVTGILMIIGGAISIIVSILAIIGIAAIAYLSDGSVSLGLLYASGALLIVSSVAELIAGILGTTNCKKPEKAKKVQSFITLYAFLEVLAYPQTAKYHMNKVGVPMSLWSRSCDQKKFTKYQRMIIDDMMISEEIVREMIKK